MDIGHGVLGWIWICGNFDFVSKSRPVSALTTVRKLSRLLGTERYTYHYHDVLYVVFKSFISALLPIRGGS
jgi:hypothetical protein